MSSSRHKRVLCKVCNHEMRSCDLKRHMKRKDHQTTNDSILHESDCSDDDNIGKYPLKCNDLKRHIKSGEHFARMDSLSRHKNRKYPCDGAKSRQKRSNSSANHTLDIPIFPKPLSSGKKTIMTEECSRVDEDDEASCMGNNEDDDDDESCNTSNDEGNDMDENDDESSDENENDDESSDEDEKDDKLSDEDENDDELSDEDENDDESSDEDENDYESCSDEDENNEKSSNKDEHDDESCGDLEDACKEYKDDTNSETEIDENCDEDDENDRKSIVSILNKYTPYHQSMQYHTGFQNILNKRRLLKKMLDLQDKVRMDKEIERREGIAQRNHYSRIFQPITNSINQLTETKPTPMVKFDASSENNTTGSGIRRKKLKRMKMSSGMYLNPCMRKNIE